MVSQSNSGPSKVSPIRRRGPVRFLLKKFLQGLLVVVPLAATLWILLTIFRWIDDLVETPENEFWAVPFTELRVPLELFAWDGVGFLVTMLSVTLVGMLTSNVLTGWILRRIDRLFTHVPVVKLIYSAIKDMVEAFVGDDKKFDEPVLLSFSALPEVEVIGFITREDLADFGRPGKVAVYVPQSYNFAANLILVPRERVTPIDLPSSDVMAFVVSGGVSSKAKSKQD
ncbi:MAG: putative membrane protein [Candidatus Paceibacteria bacterium]|jgi:uncharacterized membrane protein